jgi:hypothetical protein
MKIRSGVVFVICLFVFSSPAYSFMKIFKREKLAVPEVQSVVAHIPALVSERYDMNTNRYYKKLTQTDEVVSNPEIVKIMYLIEELRHSPYKFERNGEIHTSVRAAQHLMMKYSWAKNRIKTAEDFIEVLASKSSKTGRDYYVIFDDQLKVPTKMVLAQELQKLNVTLQQPKKIV